jgi:hypothetical protein
MAISKQTPIVRGFPYMPLHNATILLYPTDRAEPRVYILKSTPDQPYVAFGHSNLLVRAVADPDTLQVRVWVGHKETERFSIKYSGRLRKKAFQRT